MAEYELELTFYVTVEANSEDEAEQIGWSNYVLTDDPGQLSMREMPSSVNTVGEI